MPAARTASALPRHLALAYALLVVYACLHPLTGWKATGLPLFDYLTAPWPKYYRVADLVLNVLGYLPFGFVLVPALPRRIGVAGAVVAATLIAALLSLALETTQNFLPTRVSANVDLACNVLGALLGALLAARWGHALFDERGWLHRWRSERIIAGHIGDLGLMLLGLWLLAQLIPDGFPFGSGDLRHALGLASPLPFDPERFIVLESALVALSVLALGLLTRCMMRAARPGPIVLVLVLGLAAKELATRSFFTDATPLLWLTPGTRQGLLYGLPLLAGALLLPRLQQHALAGVALLAITVLTNLLPHNPYFMLDGNLLREGNFLNFHGLTQLVATVWPFLALAYLSALGLWRGQHLAER
jgi:VanZ family protein